MPNSNVTFLTGAEISQTGGPRECEGVALRPVPQVLRVQARAAEARGPKAQRAPGMVTIEFQSE